ncbi:MAG: aspartate aminotransferase family protein [Chloroflexi bacterium]|nr:aspartate aminotransferase family protein [Chloroflexota bacterium]
MAQTSIEQRWEARTGTSRELFERARSVLPDGVTSPVRGLAAFTPYPVYMREGAGCRLVDVDGNVYIDVLMGFGPVILGHADPAVTQAMRDQAGRGLMYGSCTELEIEVASAICQMVPSVELVRFTNSGTESTLHAMRLARGYTGKPKILKFEGHFHGNHDQVLVSITPPLSTVGSRQAPVRIPSGSGIPEELYAHTLVATWNDLDLLERTIRRHRDELAAVITEPVMANKGFIGPEPGYLQALQRICREHDVLFILDEVITGFRLAPGGAQQQYGLEPDLTTFAKAIANGASLGAFGGRREIMALLEGGRVRHAGTYNASPINLAAAQACLGELRANDGAVYPRLKALGDQLRDGLSTIIDRLGLPAIVQGTGSMLQLYFTASKKIVDYRGTAGVDLQMFQRFAMEMIKRGVYVHPDGFEHWFLSAAHTGQDIDDVLNVAETVLELVGSRA